MESGGDQEAEAELVVSGGGHKGLASDVSGAEFTFEGASTCNWHTTSDD